MSQSRYPKGVTVYGFVSVDVQVDPVRLCTPAGARLMFPVLVLLRRQAFGDPVAKLVRYTGSATRRSPGALKGQIKIYEGFDDLPPDIAASFGIE